MGKVKAALEDMPAAERERLEAEADGYGAGRGSQPVGETRVVFVRYPGGALGRIAQTGELDPDTLVAGGVVITEAEYDAELAGLDAGHAAHVAELAQADADNTLNDYGELRAAGISDAAARRMSGYTGPTPEDVE